MQKVISSIINFDQKGYINGRFGGENVRLVEDILSYTNDKNKPGAMIFLDFAKAFDSIDRNLIFKILEKFGFGTSLINLIKVIYKDTECMVTNNGWISERFKMKCGVRQGCPLSALLFILVVEIMAINIRNNNLCKGIELPKIDDDNDYTVKITQLADDTVIFTQDETSLKYFFSEIELFCEMSGLKLNKEKTIGVWIGSNKNNVATPYNITWTKEPVKFLGIFVGYDKQTCNKKNWDDKVIDLQKILKLWEKRKSVLFWQSNDN